MSDFLGRALKRSLRFFAGYGGIPVILAFVCGLFAVMAWAFSSAWSGTSSWFSTIENPTERGLAYVAVAIVFHAFIGERGVAVKVNGADTASKEPVRR